MLYNLPQGSVVVVGICHQGRLDVFIDPATILAPLVTDMTIGSCIEEATASLNRFDHEAIAPTLHNFPKRFVIVIGIRHQRGLHIVMDPTSLLTPLLANMNTIGGNTMSWIKEVTSRHNRFNQETTIQIQKIGNHFVELADLLVYPTTILTALVSNMIIGSWIKEITASNDRFNQDALLMLYNLPQGSVVVVGICH